MTTSTWLVRSPFSSASELSNDLESIPAACAVSSPVVADCDPSLILPLLMPPSDFALTPLRDSRAWLASK